jgi:protein PhnA
MNDGSVFKSELQTRSGNACELCTATEGLGVFVVPPAVAEGSAERCVYACEACRLQAMGSVELDATHWFCLREAIWSEVPAVQVVGYRILKCLQGEGWAQDLLGQVYLMEEVQEWADADVGESGASSDSVVTLDSNGTQLTEGDSVTLIKDLDVKGAGFVAKRGTMVRNIHLIDDPGNIEGRVNKITLVLKTKFLKRVS